MSEEKGRCFKLLYFSSRYALDMVFKCLSWISLRCHVGYFDVQSENVKFTGQFSLARRKQPLTIQGLQNSHPCWVADF